MMGDPEGENLIQLQESVLEKVILDNFIKLKEWNEFLDSNPTVIIGL